MQNLFLYLQFWLLVILPRYQLQSYNFLTNPICFRNPSWKLPHQEFWIAWGFYWYDHFWELKLTQDKHSLAVDNNIEPTQYSILNRVSPKSIIQVSSVCKISATTSSADVINFRPSGRYNILKIVGTCKRIFKNGMIFPCDIYSFSNNNFSGQRN